MEKLWVLNSIRVLIFSVAGFCVNMWVELFAKQLYLLTLLSSSIQKCSMPSTMIKQILEQTEKRDQFFYWPFTHT